MSHNVDILSIEHLIFLFSWLWISLCPRPLNSLSITFGYLRLSSQNNLSDHSTSQSKEKFWSKFHQLLSVQLSFPSCFLINRLRSYASVCSTAHFYLFYSYTYFSPALTAVQVKVQRFVLLYHTISPLLIVYDCCAAAVTILTFSPRLSHLSYNSWFLPNHLFWNQSWDHF